MGNHGAHAFIVRYALHHPGLMVLHDAVLHPSRAAQAVRGRQLVDYQQMAMRCRPRVGRTLGHLVAGGLVGPSFFWRFPLCEDLVLGSRLTIVHGNLLAAWLRAVVPGARVTSVPHWRRVRSAAPERIEELRRRCGASPTVPLLGCFGHIGAAHRLDLIIEGLARLGSELPFALAVVGEVDASLELVEHAVEAGIADRVHWLGRVDGDDFATLLRAVDIGFDLRFPSARSSSGVQQQLLQLGVPLVISDLLQLRGLPDQAVIRVPLAHASDEPRLLAAGVQRWLVNPEARRRAGRVARQWAAERIVADGMAAGYREAVDRVLGDIAAPAQIG